VDIFKNHYEKIAFGSILFFMLFVLFGLKSGMDEVKEQAEELTVPSNLDNQDKKLVGAVADSAIIDKALVDGSKNIVWKESFDGRFTVPSYIVCKGDDCTNVIPFNTKICPTCGANQGLSKLEDALLKDALDDIDGDGLINAVEDEMAFLDRNNKYDAFLDQDGDGFCNVQEINAELTADQVKENFLAKKLYQYNPDEINESPELVDLLRMESSNQAKKMGLTLKSVTEEEADKKMWLIAFNATKNGRTKTVFKRLGQEVTTNTGMVLTIDNIEKLETEVYNARLAESLKKTDYTVYLKSKEGQIYQVKRNEFVIHGSKTAQFVYLNHHSSKRLLRFEVEERGKFELSVQKDGKIIRGEKFTLIKIGESKSQIKRDGDGKTFSVGMVSGADKEMRLKRYEAAKHAAQTK